MTASLAVWQLHPRCFGPAGPTLRCALAEGEGDRGTARARTRVRHQAQLRACLVKGHKHVVFLTLRTWPPAEPSRLSGGQAHKVDSVTIHPPLHDKEAGRITCHLWCGVPRPHGTGRPASCRGRASTSAAPQRGSRRRLVVQSGQSEQSGGQDFFGRFSIVSGPWLQDHVHVLGGPVPGVHVKMNLQL